MKTLLIILLTIALLAAAFFTRPDKRDFMLHALDREGWTPAGVQRAEHALKNVEFRNRILWTDVHHDGKVIYSGAFSHWLPRDGQAGKSTPAPTELARLIGKLN